MHDWLLIKYLACLKKIDNCQDLCGSVVLDDERSRYFLLLNIFLTIYEIMLIHVMKKYSFYKLFNNRWPPTPHPPTPHEL